MKITFAIPSFENLGVEYLSAMLKKNGHETSIVLDPLLFNDSFFRIPLLERLFSYRRDVIKKIVDSKPDLIAFSVLYDNYSWACKIAKEIKKKLNVPIVFGGIHPTSVPEFVIKNEFVDFIVLGEGEYSFLELVNKLQYGDSEFKIKNVWYKKGSRIIKNKLRPLLQNLDNLPFPDKDLFYKELPYLKDRGIYTIQTGRGCAFTCTYCCHGLLRKIYRFDKGAYVRRRSISNLIQELLIAKKVYNAKYIVFHDDALNYDDKWLKIFLRAYQRDIAIPFYCFVHPFNIDKEMAILLRSAGCHEVGLGIESGSERVRKDVIHRFEKNSQITKAIKCLRKEKIWISADIILGFPTETERDLLKTAIFCVKNTVDYTGVYWLKYFPQTEIMEIARKQGSLNNTQIRNICYAEKSTSFMYGGDTAKKELRYIQKVIYLSKILPKHLALKIINKKWYTYIPFHHSFTLYAIICRIKSLVLVKKRYRIYEFVDMYRYFLPRKMLSYMY